MSIKIYVGNLSFDSSEDDLKGLFEAYGAGGFGQDHHGPVLRTGPAASDLSKWQNREEGLKAIQALDSKDLGGRSLKVNEARPKTNSRRRTARAREEAHAGNLPAAVVSKL